MMENCSFQNQLLSVMEVLAKAAVAEIDRRVDDCCAVLRLEVSQSRRDIELLKSKCEVMEAELRRSRVRVRRKVWSAPAEERLSASVSVKDKPEEAEPQEQLHQCAHLEPANETERVQVKEERAWRMEAEDKQTSGSEQLSCCIATQMAQTEEHPGSYPSPEHPANSESSAAGYSTFPDQQLHTHQEEAEVIMKQEKVEEPEEGAAPFASACSFVNVEAEAHLWPTDLCTVAGDPGVSFSGQQIEQIPNTFASQTSLRMENVTPRIHSAEKSHAVLLSAARVKRRARTFGYRRPPLDEGHSVSGKYPIDASLSPQPSEHPYRDNPALAAPSPSMSHCSRSNFSLVRRMRTPWRPGVGEKRFSCTYCDKGFTRFSQLKEHLRCHTGEKPFSCTQCGRSFTKQCNLIRHAVVHSGEKPYQCSLCGKCFTQRSSLKSHQKTVH